MENEIIIIDRILKTKEYEMIIVLMDGMKKIIKKIDKKSEYYAKLYKLLLHEKEYDENNDVKGFGIKPEELIVTDNQCIMIYEYENVVPLNRFIPSKGMNISKFFNYAYAICNNLFELHKKDIHGALNPYNVLIKNEGREVLFHGMVLNAHMIDLGGVINFRSDMTNYLSPEHSGLFEEFIDYKSDLYSLGCIFHKMLTGTAPFENDSEEKRVYSHATREPRNVSEYRDDIPVELGEIILKLLKKSKRERYETVYGVKKDLERIHEKIKKNSNESIEIGKLDIPCRLNFDNEYFTRKKELNRLFEIYNKCREDEFQSVLIEGEIGAGKSALLKNFLRKVKEDQSVILSFNDDTVLKNDFDLLVSNALDQLLFYCLINEDIDIEQIKQEITSVAKGCFDYLYKMIPRMKFFAEENYNSKMEFQNYNFKKDVRTVQLILIDKLTKMLLNQGNTIIINLDIKNKYKKDFEKILGRLQMFGITSRIMFIETSVSSYESVIGKIYSEGGRKSKLQKIQLGKVSADDVEKMMDGYFKISQNEDCKKNIANIINMRTNGNIFLIKEYLLKLYKEKSIYFDYDNHKWNMDIEEILHSQINENIRGFLHEKISDIPREVLSILRICSCLYNEFDSEIMSNISGYNIKTIQMIINYCVRNRIFKEKERYSTIESYRSAQGTLKKYAFESTYLKEIIYETMVDSQKEKYRYKAGLYYLENRERYNSNWFIIYCFLKTNKLPEKEKNLKDLYVLMYAEVVSLFKSGKYEDALNVSEKGIEVQEKLNIEKESFRRLQALSYFRLGEVEKASHMLDEIQKDVDNENDLFMIDIWKIEGYAFNDEFDKCEEILSVILRPICGDIMRINSKVSFLIALNKCILNFKIHRKRLQKIFNKKVEDIGFENVRRFIYTAGIVYSRTNVYRFLYTTFLSVIINNLNRNKGKSIIRILRKYYRFILNDMREVKDIANHEMLATADLENQTLMDMKEYIMFGLNSLYFTNSNSKGSLRNGIVLRNLVQYNDALFILFLLQYSITFGISSGDSMEEIVERIEAYEYKLDEYSNFMTKEILEMKDIIQKCIMGEEKIPRMHKGDSLSLKVVKAFAMYLKKDYTDISVLIIKDIDENNFNNSAAILEYGFYRSIIIAENYENIENEYKKLANYMFTETFKAFKKLTASENKHIEIKYAILQCYSFYINRDYDNVLRYACEVNEISVESGYVLGEAISNELCGLAFSRRKMKNLAFLHFNEVKKNYNSLSIRSNAGINTFSYVEDSHLNVIKSTNNIKYYSIKDIIKELGSLSQERDFESLVRKIVEVSLETIDVDRVVYFQFFNENIIREADGVRGSKVKIESMNIKDALELNVPKTILNFVLKTRKKSVINQAKSNDLFYYEKYILKNNIKSVACFPIISDGEILGLIYFENKNRNFTFSNESEAIIEQIVSAAATAVKNVKRYTEINLSKINLENLVQQKSAEIQLIEKKLLREVEERLNVEKKLNESKERGEYFANLSHEFKTPLNVILSTIQVIEINRDRGENRKTEEYLKSMKQNCYRLLRLVNNIIDLSKIDEGYLKLDVKAYNIVRIVEDICMSVVSYAQNKGISLIFDTEIEELDILCDEEKIERIILNILSNAIKFTDRGGEITVDLKLIGDYVAIHIKDNGIGIHKDVQERIFGRFQQADKSLSRCQEGSGIGLALTKQLVEMQGGMVEIDSEYGKGSEFIIKLPVDKLHHKEIEKSSSEKISSNHNFVEKIKIEFSDIYF